MAQAKKTAKKTAKKATKKATAKKATAKKAAAKKAPAKKAGKKAAKKTAKRTAASAPAQLVVASKVKEAVKAQDVRMSSEFVDALNGEVDALVSRAVTRAKDNKRGTVRPQDL
jgi:hypothetical protein